jgi:hypothetical protein
LGSYEKRRDMIGGTVRRKIRLRERRERYD